MKQTTVEFFQPESLPVLILCGGQGTRLRSEIGRLPKALAPVGEVSFLELLLAKLAQEGFRRVFLSIGFEKDQFKTLFASLTVPPTLEIAFLEEDSPLGTGGALKLAAQRIKEPFVALNGDTWIETDIAGFSKDALSRLTHYQLIIAALSVSDRSRYGSLKLDSSTGRVVSYLEKGISGPGPINSGIYLISPQLFLHSLQVPCSFEQDIIPNLLIGHRVGYSEITGDFFDIGVSEALYSFRSYVKNHKLSERFGLKPPC